MKIPFCLDVKYWRTKIDEIVTVSEFLESIDWDGESLTVVGSLANDYDGASHLFEVKMSLDLTIKFFSGCRIYSATLYPYDGIRVNDKEHFAIWAMENGIDNVDELKAKFHEYKRQFPLNCSYNSDGRIRISVY